MCGVHRDFANLYVWHGMSWEDASSCMFRVDRKH